MPQWWAGVAMCRAIQDRWCAQFVHLNPLGPTQMAIPLQMEIFLNSWSLQQERVQGAIALTTLFKE